MSGRRQSIKDVSEDFRKQLRIDCRDIGRRHRQKLLQQQRAKVPTDELQASLHAATIDAIKSELKLPTAEGGLFTDHDVDELLADIEQQIMQEIQEELAALDRAEQQDQQLASAMAEEYMQHCQNTGGEGECLLCPVCKQSTLVQRHGRLICPAEGWQLDISAESLQLSDVQHRLAAVFEEHFKSGCQGQLQFHIEDIFGSNSLTSSCSKCHAFTVVL